MQTGSQLEKGDAKAVSAALNEAWLADFTKSAQELSATDASKASLKGVLTGIDGLRSAANSNDVKSTKKAYVALVSSLSSWADAAKLKVPGL